MKRYLKAVIGFAMIVALSSIVSCKGTKVEGCSGCCVTAASLKFEDPETGKPYSLQFYNAFTPINYPFCDLDPNTEERIDSTCRPNPDTVFNDASNGLNDQFDITGYSYATMKNDGLRTCLKIRQPNDTTPIWQSHRKKSYGEDDNYFIAEGDVEDMGSYKISRPYKTGRYEFSFIVYDTLETIGDFEDPLDEYTDDSLDMIMLLDPDRFAQLILEHEEAKANADIVKTEYVLESVDGEFCIIRNDGDCEMSGCVGRDPETLLK